MPLRLLDVTLRDGGLANNFAFTIDEAACITSTLAESGVDIIEVGYFRPDLWGAKSGGEVCDLEYLSEVSAGKGGQEISVMVHTQLVELSSYDYIAKQNVDLVRLTLSDANIETVRPHCEHLERIGLDYCVNFIRISQFDADKVQRYTTTLEGLKPRAVYFADSNGSIYPSELNGIVKLFAERLDVADFGIHAHDNLGFAFANSLAGFEMGFGYVDASIGGLGKGGNNLDTATIAAYINCHGLGRFDIQRIEDVRRQFVEPWLASKRQDRLSNMMFGYLDFNHDEVEALIGEANQIGLPVADVLCDRYPKLFGRPALLEEVR